MGDLFKTVTDAGLAGFVIVSLGLFGVALIIERGKALYKDMSIDMAKFYGQVKAMIQKDDIEGAVKLCAANDRAPVAHVLKGVLQRAHRDPNSIKEAAEVSVSEIVPKLTKRLGYLAMISNVATLVGLLGTIQGLIMSFNAVSFADPSQKQALLAQGISMAMNTTALGLSVAIPVMIIYAFLNAKQGQHFEVIREYTNKTLDLLNSRTYVPFEGDKAYPADHELAAPALSKPTPPSPKKKKKVA